MDEYDQEPVPRFPARGGGTRRTFRSFAIPRRPSPPAYRRKISRTISASFSLILYSTRRRRSPSFTSTLSYPYTRPPTTRPRRAFVMRCSWVRCEVFSRSSSAAKLRAARSVEHTSELQSHVNLVCRL